MRALVLVLGFSVLFSGAVSTQKSSNIIHLTGPIDGMSTPLFIAELKSAVRNTTPEGTISIYIDSPGGSVIEGYRIVEAIKSVQSLGYKVNTVCQSMCASMAAVILEFGTVRQAASMAVILFHQAYYANDPTARDNALMVIQHAALEQIALRTGISEAQWLAAYGQYGDLWFSAYDSLRTNLVDEIIVLELENI